MTHQRPIVYQRLTSAHILVPKPQGRALALNYIERHQKYRAEYDIRCFAINVKLWSYRFKNQDEKEATFNMVQGAEYIDFYVDWNSIYEFSQKHNLAVQFYGRSAGWACLLDSTGRHGFAEEDDYEDSTLFFNQLAKKAKPIADKVVARRLDAIQYFCIKEGNFIPGILQEFIFKHIGDLQRINADGTLKLTTHTLSQLPDAPKRSDNNGAWDQFQVLLERFQKIDKDLPIPQKRSAYSLWPTKALVHTAQVLWEFNHLVNGLAEYVVEQAMEQANGDQQPAHV